jgi:S-adenosylhomocysteine hydrolase
MSSTDASSEASSFASENDYLSEYDEMSGIEGLEANISEAKQIETLDDVTAEITAADSPVISSDDDAYAWVDDPVDEEWT